MFSDICWRFLTLETFVIGALCCTCYDDHPQTDFCTSEFVLKVEIHEEIKGPMIKVFLMEIKKVFKGNVRKLKLIQNRFVILEMLDEWHVERMKPGNKFVIFGHNHNGTLHTDMCYGNLRWEKTTVFYRHALAKYYNRNCDCASPEAVTTRRAMADNKTPTQAKGVGMPHVYVDNPEHNYITRQKRCKSKYSYMGKRGTDCKWIKTRYFRLCEKGLLNGRYWK